MAKMTGHEEDVLDSAIALRDRAVRHGVQRVKDWKDTPCEKRIGYADRLMDRLHEERQAVADRMNQLMRDTKVGYVVRDRAITALDTADAGLKLSIKSLRTVRRYNAKTCKLRRK